jgi:hypothetical protein
VGTTTKARGLELCLVSSSYLVLVRLGTEGSTGPGLLTVPGTGAQVCRQAESCFGICIFSKFSFGYLYDILGGCPAGGFHGDRRDPVYLLSWGKSNCDYCAFLTSPISFWVCMCSARLNLLTRPLGKRELWCFQSNGPTGRRFVL